MSNPALGQTLSFEEAKSLARHENPKVRAALATREDLRPELLYYLAEDQNAEVRRAIAANRAAPRQADLRLALDADESVRGDLAGKIARLAPSLSVDEQNKLGRLTHDTLEILARDQITRVRQILSEILKDVAEAPPDVIKRLAQDSELVVAGPVLEFSPVLTDEDLLEIIETGPAAGGLGAIARRASITESIADAIVGTDDVGAIADLLGNTSAQIREETLDSLIDRAPEHELWHAPLVRRPRLPERAAIRLAHFVADNLLDELQKRDDLDPKTLEAVKEVVHHRLEGSGRTPVTAPVAEHQGGTDFLRVSPPIVMATRLYEADKLDAKVIGKALVANDFAFVLAALAVRAGIKVDLVQKIFAAQSAKGVVAITWKAALPMALAVQMQQRMARVPPPDVLMGRGPNKTYPLNEEEMAWQLEFFGDLSKRR